MITPWSLLALTFAIGCCSALYKPSWQVSVGEIVPRAQLPAAIALNSMAFNLSRSVGPALGGIIVAAFGVVAAFAINAVSYIGLIAVLLFWRPGYPVPTLPRESIGHAILAGIRHVAMSPNLQRIMMRGATFGVGVSAVLALLPLVATQVLGGDSLVYGLLLGSFGIGAIGGASISAWLQTRVSTEVIARFSILGFAAVSLIVGLSNWWWVTSAVLAVGGALWVLVLSLFNTSVQLSSPRWVVGRTVSLYQSANFGGMALGSWVWGSVAGHGGVGSALALASVVLLVGALLGILLPLPRRVPTNLDQLERAAPAHPDIIESRSGPVIIDDCYNVAPGNETAFMAAMIDQRRIRRRNGAGNWRLIRNMQAPEEWHETYQFPTWTELVRHKQRVTHADREITGRVRALHIGQGAPVITRYVERSPGRQTPHSVTDVYE